MCRVETTRAPAPSATAPSPASSTSTGSIPMATSCHQDRLSRLYRSSRDRCHVSAGLLGRDCLLLGRLAVGIVRGRRRHGRHPLPEVILLVQQITDVIFRVLELG